MRNRSYDRMGGFPGLVISLLAALLISVLSTIGVHELLHWMRGG